MLRIAFVSYEYPPDSSLGGIATYVAQAAQLMKSRGHHVEVFASSPTRNKAEMVHGILVHWIKEIHRSAFPIIAGHRIADRHHELAFDVIESPEYYADGWKAMELLPNLPVVVRMHTPSRLIITMSWPHNTWYSLQRLGFFIKSSVKVLLNKSGYIPTVNPIQTWQEIDAIEKNFTLKANRIVVLCNDMKVFAENKWQANPKKISLCPNIFNPRAELLSIQPRSTGMTVGFFGRLEKRKGVDLLVQAIPAILKKHPTTRFRFVGNTQEYKPGVSYKDWIVGKLSDYVNQLDFVGHVALEDIHLQYNDVDICVFPSRWENFPNVCLEAMSAAKAVVGSKFGGMREMLPNEKFGLLVDPFHTAEIVDAVCRLLSGSEERIQMGLAARERVLATYNSNIIGKEMESIFQLAILDKKEQRQ